MIDYTTARSPAVAYTTRTASLFFNPSHRDALPTPSPLPLWESRTVPDLQQVRLRRVVQMVSFSHDCAQGRSVAGTLHQITQHPLVLRGSSISQISPSQHGVPESGTCQLRCADTRLQLVLESSDPKQLRVLLSKPRRLL